MYFICICAGSGVIAFLSTSEFSCQGVVWTLSEGCDEVIEAPIGTGLVGEAAQSGRLINCCTGEYT